MDAYNDSEPSRLALATRRGERSAPSSSAGDGGCANAAVPAAQARRKSAGRDSIDAKALGGLLDPRFKYFSTSSALSTILASYSGASSSCSRSFSPQYL